MPTDAPALGQQYVLLYYMIVIIRYRETRVFFFFPLLVGTRAPGNAATSIGVQPAGAACCPLCPFMYAVTGRVVKLWQPVTTLSIFVYGENTIRNHYDMHVIIPSPDWMGLPQATTVAVQSLAGYVSATNGAASQQYEQITPISVSSLVKNGTPNTHTTRH